MLADKRFHFPLAAAQTQYRANYPGMTSAALLEVIFEDALENFFNSRRPNLTFSRAPKSEKNWDYEFEGIRFGHKVGKEPLSLCAGSTVVLCDVGHSQEDGHYPREVLLTLGDPTLEW